MWTSDNLYNLHDLPRTMTFPCSRSKTWSDIYDWVHHPALTDTTEKVEVATQNELPLSKEATKSVAKKVLKESEMKSDVSPLLRFRHVIAKPHSRSHWLPSSVEVLFHSENLLVSSNTSSGLQRLLFEADEPISDAIVSTDGKIAALALDKSANIVFFDREKRLPIATLTEISKSISAMHFSQNRRFFVAVGKDRSNRTQILVWYVKKVLTKGASSVKLYARQTSQFDIRAIKFLPFGNCGQLMSCGKNSVRFWRIKNGHLPGCSVVLGEYSSHTFTDVASECKFGPADNSAKNVFASTDDGKIFQIDFNTRMPQSFVELHSEVITSVDINHGFCVTGSSDGFIRVWPLDFSTFILESKMESPVTDVSLSPDGLQILINLTSGSTGVLNLSEKSFHHISRAHTSQVT